ncbi:MAG: FAD-binding oxidoreductase [Desulfobacterota bacterium]|nr:FAD-binding oxidoreductase [Thermodesulfobacteriota bacterium]
MSTSNCKEALAQIVDGEHVCDNPEVIAAYASDNSFDPPKKPLAVVRPTDSSQVQALVAWAYKTKTPLVPVSSGPPHFLGDTVPAAEGAVIVDLSRMNKIIMIDRRNRVVIIEPGVTYNMVQPALAREGLRLSMPLMPRATKSVLGSVLEREPITNPRYAWSLTEPLRCLEAVLGDGSRLRTGEMAGASISTSAGQVMDYAPLEEVLEKRRKIQETVLYQYGPGQFNYYKLVSAAQGTMGIVTWASLRCEVLPEVEKFFLVPAPKIAPLIDFAYRLLRLRFHDALFIVNGARLAFMLGENRDQITRYQQELPPWVLILGVAGRGLLPRDKVSFLEKDIKDIAQHCGIDLKSNIGSVHGDHINDLVLKPSPDPYWKLRSKGGCQDIFFLSTLNRASEFISTMVSEATAHGYTASDIGMYIQPTHLGTSCHMEFNLPFHPAAEHEVQTVKELYQSASYALSGQGAFFSRPYGMWSSIAFGRNPMHTDVLRKIKALFDPHYILNPGKLCFQDTP